MFEYKYFPDHHLIVDIIYGECSSQQLNEFICKLTQIDCKEGGMRGLTILCKGIKLKDIGYKEIFAAGNKMKQANYRENGKSAIVAHSMLGYGLSRMYQVATGIAGLDEVKVYKENDLSEAINWLGVEDMTETIMGIVQHCESADTDEL